MNEAATAGHARLTVLYDADCGICTHTARLLTRLDSRHRLRLVPLGSAQLDGAPPRDVLEGALHATDDHGAWFAGATAAVEIACRVPLLRPMSFFARLPLAMPVLELAYNVVANNRQTISRVLGLNVCKVRS